MDIMQGLVSEFGSQLLRAVEIGKAQRLPVSKYPIHNVAVVGLGGSAFGGELTKNFIYETCKTPFQIFRGYDVPAAINQHSLAILSSYSGNTEETLSAAERCLEQRAQIVCITSGGALESFASRHSLPFITLPGGFPPRAACGFSFVQQLFVLYHYQLIDDFQPALLEAINLIENFGEKQLCANIAKQLFGKAVIIYSSDSIDATAIRLRQQINENAKQLCWHHTLPEMNHNELVGWELPQFLIDQAVVIFLRSAFDHPRVQFRIEVTKEIISKKTNNIIEVNSKGFSKLAHLLYLLHVGDWISVYLAIENNVEATPVHIIDYLKNALTQMR